MCPNAKTIDFVALLVQTQYGVFIYVIRSHYGQFGEPRQFESFRDLLKRLPSQHGQVSQVPAVYADAHRPVPAVVKGQCHSAEVQQPTPVENKSSSITTETMT